MANSNPNDRPRITPADLAGGVDITKVGCHDCRHSVKGDCRRYPPSFILPHPHPQQPGALVGGAYRFPPASVKCGEFAKATL